MLSSDNDVCVTFQGLFCVVSKQTFVANDVRMRRTRGLSWDRRDQETPHGQRDSMVTRRLPMVSGKSTECRVEGIVSVKRKVWDVNQMMA